MRAFFLIFFIILSTIVSATNYYVSPSGNNANTGTLSSPFKTISYGESKLKAGDILYVRSGTYNEYVLIWQCDGTFGSPTIISAYPGESPIIDGTGIDPGNGGSLVRIYASYITFTGFEVRNVNMTGVYTGNTGIYNGGNYVTISYCTVHDTWGTPITINNCNNSVIEYCTAYDGAMSNYGGNEAWNAGGIQVITCTNSTVRHCTLHDIWGEGLTAFYYSTYITIEDNIIYDIWTVTLYLSDATNCLVQRNLIYHTKVMGNHTSPVGIGIWNERYDPTHTYFVNPNANHTILNNIVYGCQRNFCSTMDTNGEQVYNNIFVNSLWFTSVAIAGVHTNSYFTNNIVVQEDGLLCIYIEPGTGLVFSNNLFNKSYDIDAIGVGDVIGDPKLAKAGETGAGKLTADYFKLLGTSPAINKGAVLSNVTNDFFLNPRDATPDIGTHEFYAIDPSVKVTGITVTGEGGASTITADKGILQLSAEISPSDATNKTVTWSIANGTGQATITYSGLVMAITNGTVTARATANDGSGVYGTLVITLSNQLISVTSITVSGDGGATMITTGSTLQLSAAVLPSNASNKTVTWSITNGTGQASINSTGLVTAVAPGTVTVKANASDGSGVYGTLLLTIANQLIFVADITVTGTGGLTTITVDNGTLQLNTSVSPSDATNKTVMWSIAIGTGQASINSSGLVTAIANGTVTAKAIANDGSGVYGTLVITISIPPPNNLPVIEILSPLSGKHFVAPATINITADSYDTDGTITKVEFYFGPTKIGESLTAPYSCSFECTETGAFELIAVATDNLNAVAYSPSVIIYSSSDIEISDFFNLYPNPNDGHFTIDFLNFLKDERNSVTIVDLTGKVIYEGIISNEENTMQFDLSYLNSGFYILIITGSKIIFTKKFIIM